MRAAAFAMAVLIGMALTSTSATARSTDEKALGKYILQCDRQGKPEAVYGCALERSVQAGVIDADIATACRNEVSPGLANANGQIWNCVKRRQFAGQRSSADRWNDANNECDARSRTAGHRYQGRQHECIIDTAIAQRLVTNEQAQGCRNSPSGETTHRLMNCLRGASLGTTSARAPAPASGAATNAAEPAAERNSTQSCTAYAKQIGMDAPQERRFVRGCRMTEESPEAFAATLRAKDRQLTQAHRADDGAYPREGVLEQNRSLCEQRRASASSVQFRCDCVVQEAGRQLDAGRLNARSVARQEFDTRACIDRSLTAQRYTASVFSASFRRQLAAKNIHPDAVKACYVRAIEHEIDPGSFHDLQALGKALVRRCL